MTTLLVADDEPMIRELLAASLRHAGFDVVEAADGATALHLTRSRAIDLLLLDVMMPGLDGFEVVRRLRAEHYDAPVLFLTARDSTEDTVRGLGYGGDDYVTKPFKLDEVIARVSALLRRAGTVPSPSSDQVLHVGALRLDLGRHRVWCGEGEIDLTPTEFKLLAVFMRHPGRVLSKAQLLDQVWEYDFGGDSNIVEAYVSYLRRKLSACASPPAEEAHAPETHPSRLIQTVRGVGYRLNAEA